MAEILHHLLCKNPTNNGRSYLSTGAGFQPSTVVYNQYQQFLSCNNPCSHPRSTWCLVVWRSWDLLILILGFLQRIPVATRQEKTQFPPQVTRQAQKTSTRTRMPQGTTSNSKKRQQKATKQQHPWGSHFRPHKAPRVSSLHFSNRFPTWLSPGHQKAGAICMWRKVTPWDTSLMLSYSNCICLSTA